MLLTPVLSPRNRTRFILFPYSHYKNDPTWVPPLRSELKKQFDVKKNPTLEHIDYQMFLLEDDGKMIGRIAAFIDTIAVDFWGEKIGLFGYYDCIDDDRASKILFDAAEEWLTQKGMTAMRGPWSFVSQEWGLVIEGFEPPPTIMAPYNLRYYEIQIEAHGLTKVKDLLCYYISAREGYKVPDRILRVTDVISKRYGVTVRMLNMKQYDQEVEHIIEISNHSLIDNWGYSPVTDAEADAMAKDLKQIVQKKGVLFAEDSSGRAIGFIIALPNINVLLKGMNGRLLPFGWLRLLTGMPKIRSHRIFALAVLPEYHGKGVDSLIYRKLYETLYTDDIWMEINYVLEDNHPMNNAIVKLGAKLLRKYRVYQKEIRKRPLQKKEERGL